MERKRRASGRATGGESSMDGESPEKREKVTPCIQYTDVTAASFRIRKGVKETPLKVGLNAMLCTGIKAIVS